MTETAPENARPIWEPSEEERKHCARAEFARGAANDYGYSGSDTDYGALHAWSVAQPGSFWAALGRHAGLEVEFDAAQAQRIISSPDVLEAAAAGFGAAGDPPLPPEFSLARDEMPGAVWFPGFHLNYVDEVLRAARRAPGSPAIVHRTEAAEGHAASDVQRTALSWGELIEQAEAMACWLRVQGVRKGDRVAAYVPDISEAMVALLATAWLGAIWTACGQDYAPHAAAARMGQLEPTVLITADGYRNGGQWFDKRADSAELARQLPGEVTVVEIRRGDAANDAATGASENDVWQSWQQALTQGRADLVAHGAPPVEKVAFDHPLWVLFSSGTTGKPKGIVHGHGGVVLEHIKVLSLHCDMRPGDVFFWYTTPSWMMWNLRVSALLVGATVACYEGSPVKPPAALWEFAAAEQVSFFGTSPGQILATRKAGISPAREYDLSALRAVSSTGSTLPVDSFHWIIEHCGGVPINSISGGTDVVSGFAGGQAAYPVYAGELSCAYLGCDLHSWSPQGEDLCNEVGEMVIGRPMPSMPVEFWNDFTGERYASAYFEMFPEKWRHGDWIKINDHGGVTIHGRSDATLNRNGIRMGSADIYGVVEEIEGIAEAFVLGVEGEAGKYWMPLFVVLQDGVELDEALREKIRTEIKRELSPRHVPDEITEAPGVPHTKTGKKLEVPVTAILAGRSEVNVDPQSLDRPELLDWYREQGEKHSW